MLKYVFRSRILKPNLLGAEAQKKGLLYGKLTMILAFFLSKVPSFSLSKSVKSPYQSLNYLLSKYEVSETVQERQLTYKLIADGVKVGESAKRLAKIKSQIGYGF
jgi:hypothetical protein